MKDSILIVSLFVILIPNTIIQLNMKHILFSLIFLSVIQMVDAKNNPFFSSYKTPHETPPFNKIKNEHFEPAFEEGIKQLQKEIDQIANSKATPTFENTVVALERSGRLLSNVSSVFFNLLNAESNDEMMEMSLRISPKLTESSNNIYLNENLFKRVKSVYEKRNELNLNKEDAILLEETFKSFADQGANLSEADKETFRQLKSDLSMLSLTFGQNALKDKNRYEMLLTKEADLAGLPESVREAAAQLAKEKGKEGWMIDLSAPSYIPFMRYSDNRSLREELYKANMKVGNNDNEFDNKEVIRKLVNTRLALANLLGYRDFAEYVLKDKMAKNEEAVYNLLNDLIEAYKPTANYEYNQVVGYAMAKENKDFTIMPWDWNYYSEQIKKIRFDINDEMTRPYFELEHVKKSVFGLATQLYGITFKETTKIPVYHSEVSTYEVYDEDGSFLSVLYTDFFPREGKRAGAWMNDIRPQYINEKNKEVRPLITIVMNFTRPVGDKPALLSFDEVETLLHEFGHALHGILADGTYSSLSGTNVKHDFVELPSQIMENWLTEKEYLDQIAVHYETGEKMPQEMIQNIINASNFNTGYMCLRQVSFGLLDMAWHSIRKPFEGDVAAFEHEAWKNASILPEVPGALMSTAFGHIFSGGYSAGYYGYKWAEVLDADAFAAFKENGIFDKATATAFRTYILSKGNTEDPSVLYKQFRGKEPSIEALLKRTGVK